MISNNSEIPTFDKDFSKFDIENRAGLAVMAIEKGVAKFKKGYGLRNLETNENVDCYTNFRMASVSKQFTAMCIAILEEKQKLSVEDEIDQYLSGLPKYMSEIRVSHLVHHLSGLPDYSDALWNSDKNKPLISNQDVFDYYKSQKKLKFKPGEKYKYSNGGYSLLSMIVENVAGEYFPDFIDRNIFKPSNMKNTAVITYPSMIKNQAVSYSDWPFFEDIDYNTGNALHGEDGVYTSLNDMQGWIEAIETNRLVSPTVTEKLFAPARTNSGKKVKYGYGWEFDKFHKHRIIGHDGVWVGFNTIVVNVPARKLWLVAFSNSTAISSFDAMEKMFKYYLAIDQ